MKAMIAAGLAAFLLAGCTVADVATARRITVDDGARYIEENHERRRQIRATQDRLRDRAVDMLQIQATMAAQAGDWEQALKFWTAAGDILRNAYPSLATIELLKEGAEGINELRHVFKDLEFVANDRAPPD